MSGVSCATVCCIPNFLSILSRSPARLLGGSGSSCLLMQALSLSARGHCLPLSSVLSAMATFLCSILSIRGEELCFYVEDTYSDPHRCSEHDPHCVVLYNFKGTH